MKRYSPSRPGSSQMMEDAAGAWVRYEDVMALTGSTRERLDAVIARLEAVETSRVWRVFIWLYKLRIGMLP